MILVTGATGATGTALLQQLAALNIPVRALVRDRTKAHLIASPNIEVVYGDFDHPATLPAVLAGIERAFLLTNSSADAEAQQLAFVAAAQQSGVTHMVKLSQLHAAENSPVRFLHYHAVVEAAIRASGMAYTFLRPNLFMQGLLSFAPMIQAQSAFYAAAGDAPISLIDVRDIAAAATAALTQPGHAGKIYNLTGPAALTHGQIAATLSAVLGRTITFVDIPPETMQAALLQMGMPAWQAAGLIEDYAHYRRGEAAEIFTGVQDATGQPPRTFAAFAHEYAALFR